MYVPGARIKCALPGGKNPALKLRRIGLGLIRRPQKLRLATEKNLCALLSLAIKIPALTLPCRIIRLQLLYSHSISFSSQRSWRRK
jgi:hypothetical protein